MMNQLEATETASLIIDLRCEALRPWESMPAVACPYISYSLFVVRLHDSIQDEGFHYLVFDL